MRAKLAIAILLKCAPLVTGFLATTSVVPSLPWKIVALGSSIFLYVISEVHFVFRPTLDLIKIRRKLLDEYVKAFDEARIGDVEVKLRVNLMLVTRPWWFLFLRKRFEQHWHNREMARHPDANLVFWADEGCCGYEFKKRTQIPSYHDLRKPLLPGIKLSKRMKRDAPKIEAILTIPLRKARGDGELRIRQEYFGVLNIDALDDAGADLLQKEEMKKAIIALAAFVENTFP
jgi:hypothetical protein